MSVMTYTEILHKYGQHACGQPAFLYRKDKLHRHAPMAAEHALTLTGKEIEANSACVCGTCGYALHPWLVTGADREIG
jgi:hypothetical protein